MSEDCKKISIAVKMMSSKVLFCPTNSTKPQNIQFTVISNREKQIILTLVKLKLGNRWHFCLKIFFVDQQID